VSGKHGSHVSRDRFDGWGPRAYRLAQTIFTFGSRRWSRVYLGGALKKKPCGWPIISFRRGTRQRRSSVCMPDVRYSRSPWQLPQTKGTQSTPSTLGITPWRHRLQSINRTISGGKPWIKSQFLRETISQNLVSLMKIIELPSAEACRTVSRIIGKSIDFLHIDGVHSEAQALADVTNWSELVVSGGMIVLDDIDWPGVRRADEFLAGRFERVGKSGAMVPPFPRTGLTIDRIRTLLLSCREKSEHLDPGRAQYRADKGDQHCRPRDDSRNTH